MSKICQAPLIRDVISALAVVPTSVGSADNNGDKNLINFRSYQIITKTVRGQYIDFCFVINYLT
jgi:hypothetical protein